jgi:hypothetical protein
VYPDADRSRVVSDQRNNCVEKATHNTAQDFVR